MAGQDMEHADLIEGWTDEWLPPFRGRRQLLGHQKVAVSFLHHREQESGFALLCDAMGIGKVYSILRLLIPDNPNSVVSLG
jgi:hypothetical protein